MRTLYKYTTLLLSLVLYTWFIKWYVLVLLILSFIVVISDKFPPKLNLFFPIGCLIAGFVMMKYLFPPQVISLPVGYSVFAFSCISYLVDSSKGIVEKKQSPIDVLCYLFFFPKMLCGPLIRFSPFNKQLNTCKMPTNTVLYMSFKIIVYSAFCKFCIADNLAWIVNSPSVGINAWCSSFVFATQIYLDFFAYSNFAIAFALLLGIQLPTSFNSPYRSITFRDFWHRWNITISEWLRDYIYIPLGGSRNVSHFRQCFNVVISFIISGLWHGATFPFIIWGVIHGFFVAIEQLFVIKHHSLLLKWLYSICVIAIVCLLWQLFRLPTINAIHLYINSLFTYDDIKITFLIPTIVSALIVWTIDDKRLKKYIFSFNENRTFVIKEVGIVSILLFITILFHAYPDINFFYFKF